MKAFALPTIFTAVDRFSSKVIGMGKGLDSFVSKAQRSQQKLDNTFSSLGGNVVAGGVVAGVGLATFAVKKFIDEASKIENAEAFFSPILGSTAKATQLVEMLNKEAAITPFRFEDLSSVASSLLPLMDGDLNKVVSTFRLLGDTAGGSVDKLHRITLGYTKALLKGKVTLESLNIIAEAGVPIFDQMAKAMNLGKGAAGTAKLFKMITAGQVPVEMLTKTFEKMGSEGGLFYKGMITASETFSGITSTLEDNISMTAASIGKELLPYAKEFALKAIEITGKIREWVGQNKELIATKFKEFLSGAVSLATKLYHAGAFIYKNWSKIVFWFKIYIGLLIALKAASIIIGITTTLMNLLSMAVWLVEAAQWAWNAAMSANPIGLVILAIVALIAIVVLIIKYWEEWGAAVNVLFAIFMPGIALIISSAMTFYKHWEMITEAFKSDGILGGLMAIGKALLDVVLDPLQQILEIIAKVTGADWAANLAGGLKSLRVDMRLDKFDTQSSAARNMAIPLSAAEEEKESRNQAMQGVTQNQNTTLTIKNQTNNKIDSQSDNNLINIKMGSTMRFGY